MYTEYFFPTPIYIFDVPNAHLLNDALEKNIVSWANSEKGLVKTNVNGWHSETNMHMKPEYKDLVTILHEAQREIYNKELLAGNPVLGNMWANINYKGGFNRPHVHPNCLFSGVYYIKTPEHCGHLKFEDPRPGRQLVMPAQKEGPLPSEYWREVHYKPIAGRLIMFPFWLNHMVEANESNDIRISVSFNFLQDRLHNLIKPEDIKQ